MSEIVRNPLGFRPGPPVEKAYDFFVDVSDRLPDLDCKEEEHEQFEPNQDSYAAWYKLFYDAVGLDYGPPTPYANCLYSIELTPILPLSQGEPAYVMMHGGFLDERAVDLNNTEFASVHAMIAVDVHEGRAGYMSFRVVEGAPDRRPMDDWQRLDPDISDDIARMMLDQYYFYSKHDPHRRATG